MTDTKLRKKAPKAKNLPFPLPKQAISAVGHNRPGIDPHLISSVEKLEKYAADKKAISRLEKEVRNEIKQNGTPLRELNQIIRERQLDPEVRTQQRLNYFDIQVRLGEQLVLPVYDNVEKQTKPAVLTTEEAQAPTEASAPPTQPVPPITASPASGPAAVAMARSDGDVTFSPNQTVN